MKAHFTILSLSMALGTTGQTVTNITCTSGIAQQVMKGLHDPADFAATTVINDHEVILCEMRWLLNPDSLRAHIEAMETFHSRNSYSDTVSAIAGIGAARRWAFSKFQQFSAANEDRLIPAYLQFDHINGECGDGLGWRNVLAVLPGSSTTDHQIVIIEAHLDSRCSDNCDPNCAAPGMEDNGSGSALVIELARVMSRYTFKHTLVFMLTTAEEHGLVGATAMAQYCEDQGIAIKGVQNNDIVGGIMCGETSSPPSCPGPGDVDSLQVRLFSNGSQTLPHRGFARTVKMFYQEKLQGSVGVPMTISVMSQELIGTGRGGDAFREKGYRNVRFTSANEHGDASVDSSWYSDHQHTSDDVLGVDTDGDLVVDSFFVDFNYLQRNTLINGMSTALLALGPEPPAYVVHDEPTGLRVEIIPHPGLMEWRIGVRDAPSSVDFDAVYRTSATSFLIPDLTAPNAYFISVAGIDSATIMSPFTAEVIKSNDMATPPGVPDNLPYAIDCNGIGIGETAGPAQPSAVLLPCQPNPFTGHTLMQVELPASFSHHEAWIAIGDVHGREVTRLPIVLQRGTSTVEYRHRGPGGAFTYGLVIDGGVIATRSMVVME